MLVCFSCQKIFENSSGPVGYCKNQENGWNSIFSERRQTGYNCRVIDCSLVVELSNCINLLHFIPVKYLGSPCILDGWQWLPLNKSIVSDNLALAVVMFLKKAIWSNLTSDFPDLTMMVNCPVLINPV